VMFGGANTSFRAWGVVPFKMGAAGKPDGVAIRLVEDNKFWTTAPVPAAAAAVPEAAAPDTVTVLRTVDAAKVCVAVTT